MIEGIILACIICATVLGLAEIIFRLATLEERLRFEKWKIERQDKIDERHEQEASKLITEHTRPEWRWRLGKDDIDAVKHKCNRFCDPEEGLHDPYSESRPA